MKSTDIKEKFGLITDFIRNLYPNQNPVPLHAPIFQGNEKKYLINCIDTTYVSYIGQYVTKFENMIADYIGVNHAVALVNGTAALQISLQLAGVGYNDEVLTQALTFVATANAINHAGGKPVFIDSETKNLGMDPNKLADFLKHHAEVKSNGQVLNKLTDNRIAACVPAHIFGHPASIKEIIQICAQWQIPVVEDAAESIGSTYKGQHMGTFGIMGTLSFNGNKIITSGGGGMIVTNDAELAKKAKHITSTAKVPHPWEFFHDEVGYNYRLPNLNAAIGCAQMEQIDGFIASKRELAGRYAEFFQDIGIFTFSEPPECKSNYWLNTIILNGCKERDEFLKYTNEHGVMTRPAWILMNKLPMFRNCQIGDLSNAIKLTERIVNLPSSVRL